MMASPFTLIFLMCALCVAVQDGQWWWFAAFALVIEFGMALLRGYARDGVG